MHNINLKKLTLLLVLIVILTPPATLAYLYLKNKFFPSIHLFELTYTEILDETAKNANERQLIFTYCFEVPSNLKINNDLQDFFVQMTRKDIKEIVMSDVTGIDKFSYQTKKGCGDYTALVSAETVETAYPLYLRGEL